MTFYERRGNAVYTEPVGDQISSARFVCECVDTKAADDLVEKLNALPEYVQQFDQACEIGGDAVQEYVEVDEVFNRLREIVEMKP